MFNLRKLMTSVKNGEFFGRPFNIKKKAWEDELDPYAREDAENRQSYHEQGTMEQSYDPFVEEGYGRGQDAGPGPTEANEGIKKIMLEWIVSNAESIKRESGNDIYALMDILKRHPEDSTLEINNSLSAELISNIAYEEILSNMIVQNTMIEEEKADILVQTLIAKSQTMIYNREQAVAMESEPDIQMDETYMNAYSKFLPESLNEDQQNAILKAIDPEKVVGFYNGTMLEKAMKKKFAPPQKPGAVDQRLSFFLANPEFLLSEKFSQEGNVFSRVPTLEGVLREELKKFGIGDNDISVALRKAYGKAADDDHASARSPMTKILAEQAGDMLLDILNQLINKASPSIARWFAPSLSGAYKGDMMAHYTGTTEDGKASEGNLTGKLPSSGKMPKTTEEEMDQSSKLVAGFAQTYLTDQLGTMNEMKKSTIQKIMLSNADTYINLAQELPTAKNPEEVKKQMTEYLQSYTKMETVSAFAQYSVIQFNDVFNGRGRGFDKKLVDDLKKVPSQMKFENEFGKVFIPKQVILDVYDAGKRGTEIDKTMRIDDFDGLARKYIRKIESGEIEDHYSPDWKYMVNSNLAYNTFADAYAIKKQIIDMNTVELKNKRVGIKEPIENTIYNNLNNFPETKQMLDNFSGVSMDDEPFAKEEKKKNFIYMTLQQGYSHIKRYKDAYNWREKYNKQKEEVLLDPSLSDTKKTEDTKKISEEEYMGYEITYDEARDRVINDVDLTDKQKAIMVKQFDNKEKAGKKNPRVVSPWKSAKSYIGDNFWPMLPYIVQSLESIGPEDKLKRKAAQDFMRIFDHNSLPYEKFQRSGQMVNKFDPQERTNTELYYLARYGEVPERIKQLMNITNQSKKDILQDDTWKKWYNKFFKSYFSLIDDREKVTEEEKKAEVKQIELDQYIKYFMNPKVYKIINNPREYKKVLQRVPPEQMKMFQNTISDFDRAVALPDEYYKWIGMNKPIDLKNNSIKSISKSKEDLAKFKEKIKVDEIELENSIQQAGKDFNIYASSSSIIKIAHAEYKKVILRINSLYKIKKSSYKFASIKTSSIDDSIKDIRRDFDNFFDRLIK